MRSVKYMVAILIVTFIIGCSDDSKYLINERQGDYYPTGKEHRWVYRQTQSYYDHVDIKNDLYLTDTFYVQLTGRGQWNGTTNTHTEDLDDSINFPYAYLGSSDYPYYSATIKKTSHLYYNLPPYYTDDQLFLVDDKPVGYTWTARGMEHTVVEVNSELNAGGRVYKNLIHIRESTPNSQSLEINHFYAKNVGEIYSITLGVYDGYKRKEEFILLSHTKV